MKRNVLRTFVTSSFLVFALFSESRLSGQAIPPLVSQMGHADMILVNGKIVSMDDRSTTPDTPGNIHQAMAIKGKKIMALGTNEAMKALAGPATITEDAGGRVVIPGL